MAGGPGPVKVATEVVRLLEVLLHWFGRRRSCGAEADVFDVPDAGERKRHSSRTLPMASRMPAS